MTAATIKTKVYEFDHTPGQETVVLTATDGETYTSRKFKTILGAHVSANADQDAHINVTYSGSVATINFASQTDKDVTLTLYGKK